MSSRDCSHRGTKARALEDPDFRCERCLENGKNRERKLREEALAKYGGVCACCGEFRHEFLALDHINGGGRVHRRAINTPLPRWLKKNGWPEGFRVLCHNCNMAKGRYGACPHEREQVAVKVEAA